MSKLDPFSAQIVQLVREMPDEAILELIRNKLGAEEEAVETTPSAPAQKKAKATRRKKASSKRKTTSKKSRAKKATPKKKAPAERRAKKRSAPKKKAAAKKKSAPNKRAAAKKKSAPNKRAGKKKTSKKRGGAKGGDRQRELEQVERAIQQSKGLSASDLVKRTKLSRSRVSAAVRQLKDAGRIHQGGDRRFARYAADAKTAVAASEEARRTASGPQRKR